MDRLTLPLRPGMEHLLEALDAARGATRLVGGAVRDALIGRPFTDIDLATRLIPDAVLRRLKSAGIKAVPTGIAHGTITAVTPGGPVEVTTLRRDITTDGRHATVAFASDWSDDAARRDFTINALYADPIDGELFDYFGGRADLAAGRVRFIGEPLKRIAEDHLRILRFFRFHARYGEGDPDEDGLLACIRRANDLMALSRERIADELVKLLGSPDPTPTVALMLESDIFAPVIPQIDWMGLDRLRRTVLAEARGGIAGDPIRRLAALLPDRERTQIARRLRLSKARIARIDQAIGDSGGDPRALGYRLGTESAIDRLLIAGCDPTPLVGWKRPAAPITGGALIARGLTEGPAVARLLKDIEDRWIAEGFPNKARVAAIADEAVAQSLAPDR